MIVYNMLGQEVRTQVQRHEEPGFRTITWDGKDNRGEDVASGVYLYQITAGNIRQIQKMILLR